MASADRAYVFGYGSLAGGHSDLLSHHVVHVGGFRRRWNVAMDNRVTLPDYKYYVDPVSGSRPALFVTFLNVVEDPSSIVNGVLLPIRTQDLDSLDLRERNYSRLEVTEQVVEDVAGRVWVYTGSDAARRRYETGMTKGSAVVDDDYYNSVRSRFQALGEPAFTEFMESTDAPECPRMLLRRVSL